MDIRESKRTKYMRRNFCLCGEKDSIPRSTTLTTLAIKSVETHSGIGICTMGLHALDSKSAESVCAQRVTLNPHSKTL